MRVGRLRRHVEVALDRKLRRAVALRGEVRGGVSGEAGGGVGGGVGGEAGAALAARRGVRSLVRHSSYSLRQSLVRQQHEQPC